MKIQKPTPGTYPAFMQNYINQVPDDGQLVKHMKETQKTFEKFILALPENKLEYRYAEGKWTIKEVIVHLSDAERIFGYRALRFARTDKTLVTPFDENIYVPASHANERSIKSILEESRAVRAASIALIKSFNKADLKRGGASTSGSPVTVLSSINVMLGHQLHHWQIIKERYL